MRPGSCRAAFGVAAAVALVFALIGCGSGNESVAETAPHLTKTQVLKKGIAICLRGRKEIAAGLDPFEKKRVAAGRIAGQAELEEDVVQVILPVRRIELRRLRALGMPKEGARQFQAMLDAMEEGIEMGEHEPSRVLAAPPSYVFEDAYKAGIRFGLVSCWLG
jgi:hypothetical protein